MRGRLKKGGLGTGPQVLGTLLSSEVGGEVENDLGSVNLLSAPNA